MKRMLLHLACLVVCFCVFSASAFAAQTDIVGLAGSGSFGNAVVVLPNGNIVVTDPQYDAAGGITDVGAVYVYDGATLALISTLTGSKAGDFVGSGGITVLTNGNFLVNSPNWDNPSAAVVNVGAVTWCSSASGCSGAVSSSNSLTGATANDQVGAPVALANGNYVVRSEFWDNPSPLIADVGAVTWGNGATGSAGVVSALNSLIGSTAGDRVGASVTALTNGNYVVASSSWDSPSPALANVGAVTWGDGAAGTAGVIAPSNSLVGTSLGDGIGNQIYPLANGNFVVRSDFWDNPSPAVANVGAVTWASGTSAIAGTVSSSNSLIGSTAEDRISSGGVTALSNGNYVVNSPNWDNPSPATANVGAVTWGSGIGGTVGTVSGSNSLVGSTANDAVGSSGITALTNGNYVVASALWDNPSRPPWAPVPSPGGMGRPAPPVPCRWPTRSPVLLRAMV